MKIKTTLLHKQSRCSPFHSVVIKVKRVHALLQLLIYESFTKNVTLYLDSEANSSSDADTEEDAGNELSCDMEIRFFSHV